MINNQKNRHIIVSGPYCEPLALENLPPPETYRWMPRLKAQVVAAVNAGLLTTEEACLRYSLTVEEFVSWQRAFDRLQFAGWQVARMQHYRELHGRRNQSDVRPTDAGPAVKEANVTCPD